jgi:hypothetical protein
LKFNDDSEIKEESNPTWIKFSDTKRSNHSKKTRKLLIFERSSKSPLK